MSNNPVCQFSVYNIAALVPGIFVKMQLVSSPTKQNSSTTTPEELIIRAFVNG